MNDLVGLVSNHQQEFTPLIKLFIVMTFMMFLPTIIFMMTSFVRIIITFSFLKSALGAQQSIPNQILVGIALVLTIFIMSPVVDKINKEAIQPYREEKITFQEGIEKAQIPMKEFLLNKIYRFTMSKYVLGLLFLCFASPMWSQLTQEQLEERKLKIQQEIQEKQELLKSVKSKEKSVVSQLLIQKEKIGLKEKLIRTTEKQTKLLSDDIYTNQLKN